MAKIALEFVCSCARGRCGLPRGPKNSWLPMHSCPYLVLIEDGAPDVICNCCPACTALCLATKFVRDRAKLAARWRPDVAAIFDSILSPEATQGGK